MEKQEAADKIQEVKQYLTFTISDEVFAFDVLKIKEVLEVSKITKVPKTPKFMIGVINLRGSVVSVIDLRLKFDMEVKGFTVDSSIIIVEVQYEGELMTIGVLVDAVKEVVKLEAHELEAPPKFGMNLNSDIISAIGKKGDLFIIILDIQNLFSEKELSFSKQEDISMLLDTIKQEKQAENKE
ncbi:MAG TPA: chemotaxis protein CheW [Spirochaetia bacterium]|nr:chemotaxis protein CheW [Spirochaetia bacterium]